MLIDLVFVGLQTFISSVIMGFLDIPFSLISQFLQQLFFPSQP